ncbi:hypothetical protein Trco_001917 [Trichoderma cornu-damae]|uniref:Ketoreductase domain-containing protein n=1 Tax=Trichoderma cornu-damae TaxID=654480 RepID=A0A9P8TUJ4_9HYPO|nr:hypothetical protein Trco_001917 [Trichoderma cornu-damae]
MATFTQIFHKTSYPTISSSNPLNSQAGRTVLITGGSVGIGFAVAAAFTKAGASRVIILGRREEALRVAAEKLNALQGAGETAITTYTCDIASLPDVESTWRKIAQANVVVDILILNAADGRSGLIAGDIAGAWSLFDTNVLANLRMAHFFFAQAVSSKGRNVLINISTCLVHSSPVPNQGAYAASKVALASLVQNLADEFPVDQAQIVSVHPGAVLTEAARNLGHDESSLPWDNDFCVWASTDAAKFLHGKFVWTNWDVDELLQRQSEISSNPGMLRIGLQGTEFFNVTAVTT